MADERPVGNWPDISATQWLVAALVACAFAVIACGAGFIWAIWGNEATLGERARILTPIVAVSVAAVTFCTVGWRGRISEDQLRETRSQNAADLLQKGAELVWEKSEKTHVDVSGANHSRLVPHRTKAAAGIAILETIATGQNEKFAAQSMNILADFIHENFYMHHQNELCRTAVEALKSAYRQNPGRRADRYLMFKGTEDSRWEFITGANMVSYKNGYFVYVDITKEKLSIEDYFNRYMFTDVGFIGGKIALPGGASGCRFSGANIISTPEGGASFENSTFYQCDFSGCEFGCDTELRDLRPDECYFYEGTPPKRGVMDVNWADFLIVKPPR